MSLALLVSWYIVGKIINQDKFISIGNSLACIGEIPKSSIDVCDIDSIPIY